METKGSNFLKESSRIKYISGGILDYCPKCGSNKLSTARASMRGKGIDDKNGIFCEDCKVLFLSKD